MLSKAPGTAIMAQASCVAATAMGNVSFRLPATLLHAVRGVQVAEQDMSSSFEFAETSTKADPGSLLCTSFQVLTVLDVNNLACPFYTDKKGSTPATVQAAFSPDVAAPKITPYIVCVVLLG